MRISHRKSVDKLQRALSKNREGYRVFEHDRSISDASEMITKGILQLGSRWVAAEKSLQPPRYEQCRRSQRVYVTTYLVQSALLEMCDTNRWRSSIGLTLNLKQSIVTTSGAFTMIGELEAKEAFRKFLNHLNRRTYKAAYRHHGKRLRVIPILEKSAEGRWHYHIAIEPPAYAEPAKFGEIAMKEWLASPLGYGHGDVSLNADWGWISYMVKRLGKSGLETYTDCIDTDAYYNPPIASA